MSYILDAIKKSEAERGQGSIPSLQTVHSSSQNYKTENKQLWPYALIGLLLLNSAGLIFYFTNNTNNTVAQIEPIHTQSPTLARTVLRQDRQAAITPGFQREPAERPKTVFTEPRTTPQPITVQPSLIQPVADRDVFAIEDLPQDIKQHIPAMNFTGHVFSSSAIQRSLIINGSFMEEGDALNNDVTLTEITNKGAVFDYEGTLFEVNVLTGWNIN